MNHEIFISYAEEDRAIAERVLGDLEDKGIRCWIAPRDNALGARFESGIVKAIDQSSMFIVVLSRSADCSKYVRNEVPRAFDRDIPILVFRIEDFTASNLGFYLDSLHWFKVEGPLQEAISKFAGVVFERLGKLRIIAVEPRVPSQPLFGRDDDVNKIVERLARNSLAVIGMQGIGKSKVVSEVFQRLANGWPTGFKALVWRHFKQDKPPSFSTFGRGILQEFKRDHVEFDRLTISDQVDAVLQILKDRQALLVIDHFESVVDHNTLITNDPGFARFLSVIVHEEVGMARVLLTSREIFKDDQGLAFPCYFLGRIDTGSGVQLFRNVVERGREELKEELLREAVDRLGGHPYAIELVARNYSEAEIRQVLADENLWRQEISEIAGRIASTVYSRIEPEVRAILAAASAFFKPASRHAIAVAAGADNVFPALRELRQRALIIEVSGDLYDVHALVREFVFSQTGNEAWRQQHLRAAEFYRNEACSSRASRTSLNDIMPLLDALDHLLAVEAAEEAAALVLDEGLHEDLYWWGHYLLLSKLYSRILSGDVSSRKRATIIIQLGKINRNLGRLDEAKAIYETAVPFVEEASDRECEIQMLISLGDISYYLRDLDNALKYHCRAEHLLASAPNATLQSENTGDLANVMLAKEDYEEARRLYEEAIAYSRSAGARRYEGIWNGGLGNVYSVVYLGSSDPARRERAVTHYHNAIAIAQETNDRRHESHWNGVLGEFYGRLGEHDLAETHLRAALTISQTIRYDRVIKEQLQSLASVFNARIQRHVRDGNFDAALRACETLREAANEFNIPGFGAEAVRQLDETRLREVVSLFERGLVGEAVAKGRVFLASSAGDAERFGDLGAIALHWGRRSRCEDVYHLGVDSYTKAITMGPDGSLSNLYEARASAYALLGRLDEAITGYNEVLNWDSRSTGAALSRAEVQIWAGHFDDARRFLEDLYPKLEIPAEKTIGAWLMCHALNLMGHNFTEYWDVLTSLSRNRIALNYSVTDIERYIKRLDSTKFSQAQIERSRMIQDVIISICDQQSSLDVKD